MKVYKIIFVNNEVKTIAAATDKILFGRFMLDYHHNNLLYGFVNAEHEIEARRKGEIISAICKASEANCTL